MGLAQQLAQVGIAVVDIVKTVVTGAFVIRIKNGVVMLGGAGPTTATLALPTAGLPSAGGDDGKILTIVSTTAQAHTVTTPAAGINGVSTTLTFQAAIGNAIQLMANNGTWLAINYVNDTTPNVVIS